MATSIPPASSGGGNTKFVIIGLVLLLLGGFVVWRLLQHPPPPEDNRIHAPLAAQDASVPIGPTVGMQIDMNEALDAGQDVIEQGAEAGRPHIRYITHYVSGNCSGQIDNANVNAAARANIGGMRECYNRALRSNNGLRGNVHARWVINPGGAVGDVSTSISDPQFRSCFEGALRRVRFPPPRGGCANADFNFPLTSN